MNFRKSIFITLIIAASILFAVIVSGGCGGHSSKLHNSDSTSDDPEVDPNGPDSYTNSII